MSYTGMDWPRAENTALSPPGRRVLGNLERWSRDWRPWLPTDAPADGVHAPAVQMCPRQEKLLPWKVYFSVTSLTQWCSSSMRLSVSSDRGHMPSAGVWNSWYRNNIRNRSIMGASRCPHWCVLPTGVYWRTLIHFCFQWVRVQASGWGAKLESPSYANKSWGQFKDRLLLWIFVFYYPLYQYLRKG